MEEGMYDETIYDYGNEKEYPFEEDDETDQINQDQELIGEDEDFYDEDEPEYKSGFKDTQRAGGGREIVEGISERLQRSVRTSEEIIKIAVMAALDGQSFENMSQSLKSQILSEIEKIPKIQNMNMATLVLAHLWLFDKKPLTKKAFEDFVKKYKKTGVNDLDLLRYIRFIS
jgi:hypothetical protein